MKIKEVVTLSLKRSPTVQISLRLPVAARRSLEEAGKPLGLTGPLYAKLLLTEFLSNRHVLLNVEELGDIKDELLYLREKVEGLAEELTEFRHWALERASADEEVEA